MVYLISLFPWIFFLPLGGFQGWCPVFTPIEGCCPARLLPWIELRTGLVPCWVVSCVFARPTVPSTLPRFSALCICGWLEVAALVRWSSEASVLCKCGTVGLRGRILPPPHTNIIACAGRTEIPPTGGCKSRECFHGSRVGRESAHRGNILDSISANVSTGTACVE